MSPCDDREAIRRFDVDANSLLAAIVLDKVTAAAIDKHFGGAGRIAGRRQFDLDHFRAHLGQHQRAGRACDDLRKVENFIAVEDVPRSNAGQYLFLLRANEPERFQISL